VSADSVKYEPLLEMGTYLRVLAGPVAASGYWWYRVRLDGGLTLQNGVTTGWVAAADHDGEPWLGDIADTCCDTEPVPDRPDLPALEVEITRTKDYQYLVTVVNWTDYPAELFEPAPDLEPCGLNAIASRSMVDIIDVAIEEPTYTFCDLGQPVELRELSWFIEPSEAPPAEIYLLLEDRLTTRFARSNIVHPPSALASP
jgi:hypothetical protein